MHSLTKTPTSEAHNSHRADQLIEFGLTVDPEARSVALARVIAATVHGGTTSALHRFAATGDLHHRRAAEELNATVVQLEHERWVEALRHHVLFSRGGGS